MFNQKREAENENEERLGEYYKMAKKKKITKNYWREGGRTKSTKRKRR